MAFAGTTFPELYFIRSSCLHIYVIFVQYAQLQNVSPNVVQKPKIDWKTRIIIVFISHESARFTKMGDGSHLGLFDATNFFG